MRFVPARVNRTAAETAALIRDAGGQCIECPLDITDASAVDALLQRLRQNAEPLWVLLNNAGVAGRKALLDVTPKDFDRVLDVNTRAAFFVAQSFARALVAQGSGGRIINTCSLSAERTPAGGRTGSARWRASSAGIAARRIHDWCHTSSRRDAQAFAI